MRYILNNTIFKKRLSELNYASVADFAKKTSIHRNTVFNYLTGKGAFSSSFEEIARKLNIDPMELILSVSETKAAVSNIDEIKPIIAKIVRSNKGIAALLLGSRAKKRAKLYSDWDIGITGGIDPIRSEDYLRIKNMVEEASENIPRMIDVVNLDCAPLWFLEGLDYEPIFLDGNKESYLYFKGVLNGIEKGRSKA